MCFYYMGLETEMKYSKPQSQNIQLYTHIHTYPHTHTPPTQTSTIKSLILSPNAKYNN